MRAAFIIHLVSLWVIALLGDVLPESGPCNCEVSKRQGGWCPACRTGYIAGLRVPSKQLFEVLDAHGHDIDLTFLRCETCKKAASDDGFCETCRIGFLQKRAYFTRLTFELAQAQPLDRLSCEKCRESKELTYWCGSCNHGKIGNLWLKSRAGYDAASQQFHRLRMATEMLPTCEGCAVAYFMRSYCPTCRRSFESNP